MLATMSSELQKTYEKLGAFEMNNQLKYIFQEQTWTGRFKVMQSKLGSKQQENGYMSAHMLKLKGYFDRLEHLGFPFT